MKTVDTITSAELSAMAENMYGNFVKAVVDLQKNMLIVDMEMHADGEQQLLETGSKQYNLWGINLYPGRFGTDDFIEFDSMVNIRPRQHNLSRAVENPETRKQISTLVEQKVIS